MANKKDSIVLGVIITAAVCFIASKLWKTQKALNFALERGQAAFKDGDYQIALSFLSNLETQDYEVLQMIAECHIKLKNPANALKYLDKCIALKRSEDLIKMRFQIHSTLGMSKESFKDLFLISLLNDDISHKEKANEFLRKISLNLTKAHKIDTMASPINYSDLFDTLFFLKDEQDPAVVFINSKEFEKCYNFVVESEEPLHKLILGCFYLVDGNQQGALQIFENLENIYANILIKFIRSKKLTISETEEIRSKYQEENDPTVILYCAKIFESIGDAKSQFEALQRCLAVFPNACATCSLIVMYIEQKNHIKANSLIKLALKEYPDSIHLVCIAIEYSLLQNEVEEAMKIMELSEQLFPKDPRLYVLKYMISKVLDKADPEYLEKGISIDPKYFKLYIYYGNTCETGELSAKAYTSALNCARSFDEIFAAYRLLIVVEMQNELFKEFPDLFSNSQTSQ